MRRVRRHVFILLLAMLAACAGDPPRSSGTYIVKKGDTLYSIAWRNGVDYKDLARWNGIGRDYAIQPGQVLRFVPGGATTAAKQTAAKSNSKPKPAAAPSAPAVQWSWPVQNGKATLTTRPNGGQGFTIAGTLGQDVRAAATGRVVYTGTGLLGYGQLVIVKHNEAYLSAYGHTQTVQVREGDDVRSGQPIATMGPGPSGVPMLYFEIRRHGQPIDPSNLLPKQ